MEHGKLSDENNLQTQNEKYKSHLQTERAVLGVILKNPDQLTLTKIHIKTSDVFLADINRCVWDAMVGLEMAGIRIDLITTSDSLRKAGKPVDTSYLIGLTEGSPISQNLEHYTRMVVKNYCDRRVVDIFKAHQAQPDPSIQQLIEALINLSVETDTGDHGFVEAQEVAFGLIKKIETGENLLEGYLPQNSFPKLDTMAPLCRGELLVIAGQTSMGKTAFAMKLATGLSALGSRGIYLPYEGSFQSLVIRIFGQECGIPLDKIRRNKLMDDHLPNIRKWAEAMGGHVAFNNNVGNVSSVINKIKLRKAMGHPLDFVIIDHMHLMQLERSGLREGIIDVTQKLMQIAKDEKILIITLAQFRKLSLEEEQERPRGAFIRESSTIQQDAHHIWLLHDPDFLAAKARSSEPASPYDHLSDAPSPYPSGQIAREPAEIVVEKNREGSVGGIPSNFHRETGLWVEI
jgi:replicative DNA helicase